ncbi:MAG: hypothetical protein ABSG28_01400 [Methanoregula sp.]|uniref:hypothetical protein n=1 Tax=Methanoregula sp. TaxID=2052170 RepID=UPI003C21606A
MPLVLLLVAFPSVVSPNQGFISSKYDTLLGVNTELSLAKDPFALWNSNWIQGIPEYALALSQEFYPTFIPSILEVQDIYITNWFTLIHLFVAYLFFFLLAGLVTRKPETRMIFSTVYLFSGILLSRVDAGHLSIIYALTWIPLMYYAFFKMTWENDTSAVNIILFSVSFALIFFTGAVYYLFYSCGILGIFFLYYLIRKKLSNRKFIALFIAAVTGTLLLCVELIPILDAMNALGRIDVINPVGDGGFLENNLASYIIGTPIDHAFSTYESMALIGIIPVLLLIIALVYGREDWTIPAFFAFLFVFVWADGGNSLLSFIHLLPALSNFRVAGRMLGALLPIILLFSAYGLDILVNRIKSGELFVLSPGQKKNILYGVIALVLLKFLELPYQTAGTADTWISLALVAAFVAMLYFNYATPKNLAFFFTAALLIDAVLIFQNFAGINISTGIQTVAIVGIVCAALLFFNRDRIHRPVKSYPLFCGLLLVGLCITTMGNLSYQSVSNPNLENSSAIPIVEKIQSLNTSESQIWVLETGWPFQHQDFTYWFLKNGIHPVRAYYPNYLMPLPGDVYTIGNVTYYTADYIVDDQYLENGNQNLENVSFKVNNISVYQPDHVLPNVFLVRDTQVIPVKIDTFSPDVVRVSGNFQAGDAVVLKTTYYPGWKVNGQDASHAGNLVAGVMTSDTSDVTFTFDPTDAKIGGALAIIGVVAILVLLIRRRQIEQYLASMDAVPKERVEGSKKKKR